MTTDQFSNLRPLTAEWLVSVPKQTQDSLYLRLLMNDRRSSHPLTTLLCAQEIELALFLVSELRTHFKARPFFFPFLDFWCSWWNIAYPMCLKSSFNSSTWFMTLFWGKPLQYHPPNPTFKEETRFEMSVLASTLCFHVLIMPIL